FFFQAEDGIRDFHVTGVQTCALPIFRGWRPEQPERGIRVEPVMVFRVLERTDWLEELRRLASKGRLSLRVAGEYPPEEAAEAQRSEERRVGDEGESRWSLGVQEGKQR